MKATRLAKDLVPEVLRGLREVAAGEVDDDDEVWAEVEGLLAWHEKVEAAASPEEA